MKNKNFTERLKNTFLIYTILAVLFSSIAFAAYVSDQKINGEVSIMSENSIRITNVEYIGNTENASQVAGATFNYNTAFLNVSLPTLTSTITYELTVKNSTKDVAKKISKININNSGELAYELADYKIGDTISANSSVTFNVSIKYSDIYKNENTAIESSNRQVVLELIFEDVTAASGDDLLGENYTKESLTVNDAQTGTDFSVQSMGDGTFLLNGTYNKDRGYFRLTDKLIFSEQRDDIIGNIPVETIIPARTLFDFNVEIVSGTQNTIKAEQLKLVFRGTTSTEALKTPVYDFYSGIVNANYSEVDIGMLSLYITKNTVCKDLVVKVKLTPKEDLSKKIINVAKENLQASSETLNGLTVSVADDGLITIDGTTASQKLYIRVTGGVKISTSMLDLYDEKLSSNPMFKVGDDVGLSIEVVGGTYSTINASNYFNIIFRETGRDIIAVSQPRLDMYNYPLKFSNDVVDNDISMLAMYFSSGYDGVFDNFQFYLKFGKIVG